MWATQRPGQEVGRLPPHRDAGAVRGVAERPRRTTCPLDPPGHETVQRITILRWSA